MKRQLIQAAVESANEQALDTALAGDDPVTLSEGSGAITDSLAEFDSANDAVATLEGIAVRLTNSMANQSMTPALASIELTAIKSAAAITKTPTLCPSAECFSGDTVTQALEVTIESVLSSIGSAIKAVVDKAIEILRNFGKWLGSLFTNTKARKATQEQNKSAAAEASNAPDIVKTLKYRDAYAATIPPEGEDLVPALHDFYEVIEAARSFIDEAIGRIDKLKAANPEDWSKILVTDYPRPKIPHGVADVDGVVCTKPLVGGLAFQFHGPWRPGKRNIHVTVSRTEHELVELPVVDSAVITKYIAGVDLIIKSLEAWCHYRSATEVISAQLNSVEDHYTATDTSSNSDKIRLAGMRSAAMCASGLAGSAHTIAYHVNNVIRANQTLVTDMLSLYGKQQ